MKSLTDQLSQVVREAFASLELDPELGVVVPCQRPELADFQCNGALKVGRESGRTPRMVAEAVAGRLQDRPEFQSVAASGPGFINLRLADDHLARFVAAMATDPGQGMPRVEAPRTVIVDYGGPNVAKSLHVGHLRAGIIGQALVNLYRALGHHVIGDAHLGDWGTQIGQLICEIQRRQPELPYFRADYDGPYPAASPVTIDDLAAIYPVAAARAKADPAEMEAARQATLELQRGRSGYRALWEHIRRVSVDDLRRDYADLSIEFDYWLGESDAQPTMDRLVPELEAAGFAYRSDGALVIDVGRPEDKKAIPPLMLVKSDGAVLYGTSDLATIAQRMEQFRPDLILYVVDKRQALHFRQVFRAAYRTGIVPETVGLEHIAFGTMNGPDGKPFKTRAGGVMQLKDLLLMVKEAALARMRASDVAGEYDLAEQEAIARQVGLAALKFGDLMNHRTTDYVFDLERFVSFEGRTGPYLLYTTVRTKSILRKAAADGLQPGPIQTPEHEVVRSLMLKLTELPGVVAYTEETRAPNHICEYAYALSSEFNRFYRECHILSEPDRLRQASWLALSAYFVAVMTLLLGILGVEVPERM